MNKFKQSYQSRNSVASSTPYITTCYCYFNAQVHYPLGRSQYSRGQDHQLYTTGWREEQNGSYSCLTKRSGGQTKSVSHMTGMFITLARKGMKFVVNIKIKAVFHSWNELGYSECCSTCWDGKYPFQTDLNLPFAVWRHFTCLFRYEKAGVQCAFFTFSRRLLSLCTEFQHWQCLSSRKQGSQIAMGVCTAKELPTLQRGVAHDLIWPSWLPSVRTHTNDKQCHTSTEYKCTHQYSTVTNTSLVL